MVIFRLKKRYAEIRKNPDKYSVDLPARIELGHGASMLDCIIVDLSDGGAMITLKTKAKLPEVFTLVMTRNGRVRRPCRSLWRDGLELRVEFLGGPRRDLESIAELAR